MRVASRRLLARWFTAAARPVAAERMNVPLRRLYISRFLSLVRLVPSPDSVTTLKNAGAQRAVTRRDVT